LGKSHGIANFSAQPKEGKRENCFFLSSPTVRLAFYYRPRPTPNGARHQPHIAPPLQLFAPSKHKEKRIKPSSFFFSATATTLA
jgi:hypothetical protein